MNTVTRRRARVRVSWNTSTRISSSPMSTPLARKARPGALQVVREPHREASPQRAAAEVGGEQSDAAYTVRFGQARDQDLADRKSAHETQMQALLGGLAN